MPCRTVREILEENHVPLTQSQSQKVSKHASDSDKTFCCGPFFFLITVTVTVTGYGGGLFYIQGFVLQSMTAILPRLGPGRVPASSRDNSTLMSKATPVLLHYFVTVYPRQWEGLRAIGSARMEGCACSMPVLLANDFPPYIHILSHRARSVVFRSTRGPPLARGTSVFGSPCRNRVG